MRGKRLLFKGVSGIGDHPRLRGENEVVTSVCMDCIGDHPRLRGEHEREPVWQLLKQGSPPLTRGTRALMCKFCDTDGITPAYAGNTLKKSLKSAFFDLPSPLLFGICILYHILNVIITTGIGSYFFWRFAFAAVLPPFPFPAPVFLKWNLQPSTSENVRSAVKVPDPSFLWKPDTFFSSPSW